MHLLDHKGPAASVAVLLDSAARSCQDPPALLSRRPHRLTCLSARVSPAHISRHRPATLAVSCLTTSPWRRSDSPIRSLCGGPAPAGTATACFLLPWVMYFCNRSGYSLQTLYFRNSMGASFVWSAISNDVPARLQVLSTATPVSRGTMLVAEFWLPGFTKVDHLRDILTLWLVLFPPRHRTESEHGAFNHFPKVRLYVARNALRRKALKWSGFRDFQS